MNCILCLVQLDPSVYVFSLLWVFINALCLLASSIQWRFCIATKQQSSLFNLKQCRKIAPVFPQIFLLGNCTTPTGYGANFSPIRSVRNNSLLSSCYIWDVCAPFYRITFGTEEKGEKPLTPGRWQLPSHSFPCFVSRFVRALFRLLKGSMEWHFTEASKPRICHYQIRKVLRKIGACAQYAECRITW